MPLHAPDPLAGGLAPAPRPASERPEAVAASGGGSKEATPERISELADVLLKRIRGSIEEISQINLQARLLSINAQIEASRAGEAGRSFAVVGREMVALSERTQQAAHTIEAESETLVRELAGISRELATRVRGVRLSDLAFTNIDLIDRNLYERSCDCRWWATDAAVVEALTDPETTALRHASARLGVILKAYTVYFDIVLADRDGRVVANGRPELYASVGQDVSRAAWFTRALATGSGDEYGFEGVHASPLVNGRRVLVFSCQVRPAGGSGGQPLGVLGVVFNWDGLAQTVVEATAIEAAKRARTDIVIVEDDGRILAGVGPAVSQERVDLPGLREILAEPKGATVMPTPQGRLLVAHAKSPGFETYRSGWHSLIIERIDR